MELIIQNVPKTLPLQLRNAFRHDFHLNVRSLGDGPMQGAGRIA